MQILVVKRIATFIHNRKPVGVEVVINPQDIVYAEPSDVNYGQNFPQVCQVVLRNLNTCDLIIDFETLIEALAGEKSCRIIYDDDNHVVRANYF